MTVPDLLKIPLDEAIHAMNARVKSLPVDPNPRIFLAELLCMAGNLERADQQLEIATKVNPSTSVWVAVFRQLLRGEQTRREVFEQGRVPEFVGQPDLVLTTHLKALVALREGQGSEAATLLSAIETERVVPSGLCNGEPFSDFRDLNDGTAHFIEVITGTGKYFWIGFNQLEKIQFLPPERTRDLVWRRAIVGVQHGPEGEVFIPVLYQGSHAAYHTNAIRTGKETDWREQEGGVVNGLGQRIFLVGEEDKPVLSLDTLSFAAMQESLDDPAHG